NAGYTQGVPDGVQTPAGSGYRQEAKAMVGCPSPNPYTMSSGAALDIGDQEHACQEPYRPFESSLLERRFAESNMCFAMYARYRTGIERHPCWFRTSLIFAAGSCTWDGYSQQSGLRIDPLARMNLL